MVPRRPDAPSAVSRSARRDAPLAHQRRSALGSRVNCGTHQCRSAIGFRVIAGTLCFRVSAERKVQVSDLRFRAWRLAVGTRSKRALLEELRSCRGIAEMVPCSSFETCIFGLYIE